MTHKNHASQEWCKDPNSAAWRSAWLKAWRHDNPHITPRAKISSALPRISAMFDRRMKND